MTSHNMIVCENEPIRIPDNASTRAKTATTYHHQGRHYLLDKLIDHLCKSTIKVHVLFNLLAFIVIPKPHLFSFTNYNIHRLRLAASQNFDRRRFTDDISVQAGKQLIMMKDGTAGHGN